MKSNSTMVCRYDPRSIGLHWLTVALVVALWALGQTIDLFPKDDPRIAARTLHILLGGSLALVVSYRLWWRISAGVRLPPTGDGWADKAASLAHKLLYVLLALTVLLGLANAWQRGDTLYGLFSIAAFDPGNKALRETIGDLHALSANSLVILACLHAAAALFHRYRLKDQVLQRMLPSRYS